MAYTKKLWFDAPNPLTPLSAAAMNDLEDRIAAAATQADAYNLQPAVRVTHSAVQSIVTATITPLSFDTNRFDSDSQHYTSAAALTGTVTKTAASATLVGTGTTFTSQLSVGQLIDVPGTATERRVVTSIASDTSLTVGVNFANTAAGQTATRTNQGIVIRQAGVYCVAGMVRFAASGTGFRQAILTQFAGTQATSTGFGNKTDGAVTGASHFIVCDPPVWKFNQWDWVELSVQQTSGGALNVDQVTATTPEFGMFRVAAG